MIGLLVITDGRMEYLEQTVASAHARLTGSITERWMYDDSGDDDHRARLRERFPEFKHFDAGARQGFGGAIRAAWQHLAAHSHANFYFHLEQDFTFNEDIDVDAMADLLIRAPGLFQVALKRQPWNNEERAAGGIVELHPGDFYESIVGAMTYTCHRRFFTTNPSLYRSSLLDYGWPDGDHSEGVFTHRLLAHSKPGATPFAFWGGKLDPPKVHHIGDHRAGTGY